ncbi:twin-arginine translocation pathway signal [Nocardia sp. NPDC050630]|uniref:twin-arginine translocation pathway signal n=1 Tax=Nocardia sp. NPDC050630 TaxID=3364321 RepID=UPI0037A3B300
MSTATETASTEIETSTVAESENAVTEESPTVETTKPSRHRSLILGASVCAVIALAAVLGIFQYKLIEADRVENARVVAVQQARDSAVALLSYKPDTVDADVAAARHRLTGPFLGYYSKFTDDVVIPASKEKKIATTATVSAASLMSIDGQHARVLLFVNQSTTSADGPTPAQSASSVVATLTATDDTWLIEKFDPI